MYVTPEIFVTPLTKQGRGYIYFASGEIYVTPEIFVTPLTKLGGNKNFALCEIFVTP